MRTCPAQRCFAAGQRSADLGIRVSGLRTYLERCLQKDPRQRIRDIGDMPLILEGAFDTAAPKS